MKAKVPALFISSKIYLNLKLYLLVLVSQYKFNNLKMSWCKSICAFSCKNIVSCKYSSITFSVSKNGWTPSCSAQELFVSVCLYCRSLFSIKQPCLFHGS